MRVHSGENGCLASHLLQEHFGYIPGREDAESRDADSVSVGGICSCRIADTNW